MLMDSGCDLNHLEEESSIILSTAKTQNMYAISFENHVIQEGSKGGGTLWNTLKKDDVIYEQPLYT